MIVSRAPVRITLGGGGTDLYSYYSKYGGFLIAGAIDRYSSVVLSKRFHDGTHLSYSQTELVQRNGDIQHPIFRSVLEMLDVSDHLELHSFADVPANSGLGSSSSFSVALLNAIHTYKKEFVSHKQLAEEACNIEINVLGQPIGKQDQYMAALGGLTCLTFERNGEVYAEPLNISHESILQLENSLVLFFTGKLRSASDILVEQDKKSRDNEAEMIFNLHMVKEIGLDTRKYLEAGDLNRLGDLFHTHWEHKKRRSSRMTDPFIDECYETARKSGALGGKLIGAGGGGFLMFFCPYENRGRLVETIQKMGLKQARFHFEFDGAKILLNTIGRDHVKQKVYQAVS